jgi:hypothetical protein
MSESGDKKLIGNFRKLIDEAAADPAYNPANNKHKVTTLEAQYTAADAAVNAVAAARAPNKLAITDREDEFRTLRPLAVRSRNYLKASGAPVGVVEDADTFIRKLGGGRKSPKLKDDPNTPQNEATQGNVGGGGGAGSGSASQMSYENQIGNFESYIEIVKNVSTYTPNEADLKVAALTALAARLTAKSNAVSTTAATLDQARGVRDQLLYLNDDSVVNTAKLVKAYVQAALGSASQLYKKIKGLQFVKAPK